MSKWRHNICRACWEHLFPGKQAVHIEAHEEICCFCGERNMDSIYVRHDGTLLACKGECE